MLNPHRDFLDGYSVRQLAPPPLTHHRLDGLAFELWCLGLCGAFVAGLFLGVWLALD